MAVKALAFVQRRHAASRESSVIPRDAENDLSDDGRLTATTVIENEGTRLTQRLR